MATEDHDRKLNMIFLPYFVTSHLILLVDTTSLFATRGVNATIITTPSNALLFQQSIHPQITLLNLKFPSSEVGLPEDIENFGSITSPENGL
ncbi:hypothetical protein HYC85_008443 [Camellia sinensis]|uniref:Uncharacterized protein n=1 Tax=Camellia sinensis TaxID=4442 RepID=A0A7J7HT69_CAMSI|nr:hypothetical protein HYC85_008443 [Camellia sinensis]